MLEQLQIISQNNVLSNLFISNLKKVGVSSKVEHSKGVNDPIFQCSIRLFLQKLHLSFFKMSLYSQYLKCEWSRFDINFITMCWGEKVCCDIDEFEKTFASKNCFL